MTPKLLAQALVRATAGKTDTEVDAVVARLAALLEKKGRAYLLPEVLAHTERLVSQQTAHEVPYVQVAEEADRVQHAEAIDAALAQLGATDTPETVIDPTIAGGWAVTYRGERIDNTFKRNLLNLYQTLLHV